MTIHFIHARPLAISQTLQEGSSLRIFPLSVPSACTYPPTSQIATMPIPYLPFTVQMLPSQWGWHCSSYLKLQNAPSLQYYPPYLALYFCFVIVLINFQRALELNLFCVSLAICSLSPTPGYTRKEIFACFVNQCIPSTQNNAWHTIDAQ